MYLLNGLNPYYCGTYLTSSECEIYIRCCMRLNPYYCGTYLTSLNIKSLIEAKQISLNPYYCGTYLTRQYKSFNN